MRRLLYRQFLFTSRLQWSLGRRLTPAGGLLAGALVVAAVFGPNTRLTVAYQAFTLLAALLAVAAAFAVVRPPALVVRRRLPRVATVGEPVTWRLIVTNPGAVRRRGLSLVEEFDDPCPTLETWTAAREPQETQRNAFDRAVAWHRWRWLVEQRRGLRVREQRLPELPPGEQVEMLITATPARRGRVTFRGVAVARPDPLGLVNALRRIPVPGSLVVLPRRYPVPPRALPSGRRRQPGGVALASGVGESEEFVSLREYRPGDPVKRIHWRSWARVGRPTVLECQDEYFVRHGLVLDTFAPAVGGEIFEEAVSVAASYASAERPLESLLDLMFVGPQAYVFTAGRGVGHVDGMLEVLAGVQPCRDRPFAALHRLVLEQQPLLSGLVCVLVAWDDARRALVRDLRALGVAALVLLVAPPETPADAELRAWGVRRLAPGRIAEGLVQP